MKDFYRILLAAVLIDHQLKISKLYKEHINESTRTIVKQPSEEKLFQESDLVVLVRVKKRGNVALVNNAPHTIYYFDILKVFKGSEEINSAYFYGNTTSSCSGSTAMDEKLNVGKEYKLYLRKENGKYITTAGYKSIFKQ